MIPILFLLTLKAGPEGSPVTPIRFVLEGAPANAHILGVVSDDGKIGYAQKDGEEFVFIAPTMKPNEELSFKVIEVKDPPTRVQLKEAEHRIEVLVDRKLFTAYHFKPDEPKPYLYPVLIGDGLRLTRGYPIELLEAEGEKARDHKHHVSWWVAYGEVNDANFWMAEGDYGQQKPRDILEVVSGPVFGKIRAVNDWNRPDGKRVVQEEREYIFYACDTEDRVTDSCVTFTATDGDVLFSDTKEGGICSIRMNPLIDEEHGNGKMTNSEGQMTQKECWGKPAAWCDYSGTLSGKNVGIAIMDHPSNLRHPTCWHIRGYGLYTANCFGLQAFGEQESGDYTLPSGKELTFRYRLVMHMGNTKEAKIGERYKGYVNPPSVQIKK